MDSLTKASGVAVSVLVAATASVMLLLPTHPRLRTSRGAGMTPAIMVSSATARPPAAQPLAVGGAAHRCLPPAAPVQDCRVSGNSTGGACTGQCCPSPGRTGLGSTGPDGSTGRGTTGGDDANWNGTGRAGAPAGPGWPVGQPVNCPTGIPRRPR